MVQFSDKMQRVKERVMHAQRKQCELSNKNAQSRNKNSHPLVFSPVFVREGKQRCKGYNESTNCIKKPVVSGYSDERGRHHHDGCTIHDKREQNVSTQNSYFLSIPLHYFRLSLVSGKTYSDYMRDFILCNMRRNLAPVVFQRAQYQNHSNVQSIFESLL